MEELIKNYDYSNEDRKTQDQMSESLWKNKEKYSLELKIEGLKKILFEFSAKICVKGFKETQKTKKDWISYKTMETIFSVMETCIESKRITKGNCMSCMFELLIDLLKSGPGLAHMELINFMLSSTLDMKKYLQSLNGAMLKKLIEALKQHDYVEDGSISTKDYCLCFKKCISNIIHCILESKDKKRPQDKNVHNLILDLHITYLVQITQLPQEFEVCLSACLYSISYYYDFGSVYVGCKDTALIKDHLKVIRNMICNIGFPRSKEEIKHTTATLESIFDCCVKDSHVSELWEELLTLSKCMCLCTGSSSMSPALVTYQTLYSKLPKRLFQNDIKLFKIWATVCIDILQEVINSELLACFLPQAVSVMLKNTTIRVGEEEQWILIVQGLLRHPHNDLVASANEILEESKLKKIWSWKKKTDEAKEILNIVKTVEYPKDLSKRDLSSLFYDYGQTLHSLLERLKLAKVLHLVMGEVTYLVIKVLEMRSGEANQVICQIGDHLEFEKNKEHIPELVKRLEPLFTDSTYPWKNTHSLQAGISITQAVVQAYQDGNEIPDEVNQSMISICHYCMDDNTERYDEEEDINTVFGLIYMTVLPSYCQKHLGKKSASVISPLIPSILKRIDDPDESMCEVAKTLIMQIGTSSPQLLASDFNMLLQWCLDTESKPDNILYVIPSIYPHNTDQMTNKFQYLFKKFCRNICMDNYGYSIPLLMKVAELQPELFVKENVSVLCEYLDDTLVQYQILVTLSSISGENSEVICDHVTKLLSITDKNVLRMGAYYINLILVNVASKHQKHVKPAFDYFIRRLKVSTKDQNITLQMVDGLQKLSDRYEPEQLKLYREILKTLKMSGVTPFVRTTTTNLLQDLDSRK